MPRFTKDFVKCDRCGETYEDTHTGPTTMWLEFQSFNIEDGHHEFKNGTTTYYLCAKCEKDFFDWFLKEKTE